MNKDMYKENGERQENNGTMPQNESTPQVEMELTDFEKSVRRVNAYARELSRQYGIKIGMMTEGGNR
ncbi:MAG: hypothetical protein K5678_02150 [Acetatifactor sp.]|nr:hypothetical protein [Acetatifactor sp.]